jgi:osmotically-inducible protein OsmY
MLIMKTDALLKSEIEAELDWEPSINAANVGVAVKNGIVTLTGHLDTFAEKFAIDRVVGRVAGVQAVAVELDVKLAADHVRSDTEIAATAEDAIRWNTLIPADKIRLKVEKGWVTLTGEVEWDFQRRAAVRAVQPIRGVCGVSNLVSLKPRSTPADVTTRIRDALRRRAEREARDVHVNLSGSVVTLRGQVHSYAERDAAFGSALSAPGVTRVINELVIAS